MDLVSVRALKAQLLDPTGWHAVFPPTQHDGTRPTVTKTQTLVGSDAHLASFMPDTEPLAPLPGGCPLALGIARTGDGYRLAVRIPTGLADAARMLAAISRVAHAEIDVRWLPEVRPLYRWSRQRTRPLWGGVSISHVRSRVGTLGCFVARNDSPHQPLILSNNHVLALENRAALGDPIVQPAYQDGGRSPQDVVGFLLDFIPLRRHANRLDAALATLDPTVGWACHLKTAVGNLSGLRTDPIEPGQLVYKIGRTSGQTEGRVSAAEIDGLTIQYAHQSRRFDGLIEITSTDAAPFSAAGDSGAIVVDPQGGGVAMLFSGAANQTSYATPLDKVLQELGVHLLC